MFHSSRTTLRELKKRYLNVLKKCFLLNLGLVYLSTPVMGEVVTQQLNVKSDENIVYEEEMYADKEIYFLGIMGSYGGAVMVNGILSFGKDQSVYFEGNRVTKEGGAIYVGGMVNFNGRSIFIQNSAESLTNSVFGGAIRNYLGNINFNGTIFEENSIRTTDYSAFGGAIYNSDSRAIMSFNEESVFKNNIVYSTSGNSYAKGGAIYTSGGSVVFEDTDNNAETPAVPNITYGMTFKGDTLFTGNKAESETGNSYGGAIWNNSYMLLAGENTFGGYQTDENGDYVLDSEGNKISLGNEAKEGGAIYNSGGKKEGDVIAYGMTLGKSIFMGNTALSLGGAIWNSGYMNFTDEALFEGNKASSQGGAIRNGGVNAVLIFNDESLFKNNKATAVGSNSYGGAIYNFGGSVVFEDTDSNVETPAVPNIAYGITFNGDTLFTNNKAESETGNSYGGAISNSGYMLLEGKNTFGGYEVDENGEYALDSEGNKISLGNQAKEGGAIYNTGGKKEGDVIAYGMTLGKATFMGNTALSSGGAIYNSGYMNFTDEALFEGNSALAIGSSAQGSAVYNTGTIVFEAPVTFKNNKTEHPTGVVSGGAIYNTSGTIKDDGTMDIVGLTFKEKTVFENNKSISKSSGAYGSAIRNSGVIKFEGDVEFKNNLTEGYKGVIATVLNQKRMEFLGDVIFSGNKIKSENDHAHGGALSNQGIIVFNGHTVFENNSAELKNGGAQGGAIRNSETGTLTFNLSFEFSGNKEISGGIEKKNDIHNVQGGIINFAHGVDENNNPLIGSLDGGITNNGIINKTGAGTLILGDEMVNSGKGTFNQSAGLTIAHSEKFLAGTNNILGGVLETHGAKIGYTANIGDETHTASLIHHSTATGNSAPTSLTTALKIGASSTALFDSVTNGVQANYELSEDMAGAGTVTFKDAHLTLGQTNYNGAYVMDETVTLDLQDGDTAESVSFKNLSGSANLKIDADIVKGTNGLELVTDTIATNKEATLNLKLTDVLLSAEALDNGLNESYTATVMTGGTLTYGSEKGLVATDVYSYELTGKDNQITINAVKFNEESDVMKSIAEYDGDASFNMMIGKTNEYEMQSDVTMTANEKTIVGNGKEESTITGKKITVDGATLNVEEVTLTGAEQLIEVNAGKLNVTDAKVDHIINVGETMLSNAEVVGLENQGELIASGSTITELMNEQTATVTGGKVAKVMNEGELTVTGATITELTNEGEATVSNGELGTVINAKGVKLELMAGTRAETVTNKGELKASGSVIMEASRNEGEMTLEGVTVSELLNEGKVVDKGSTIEKLVNEKDVELTETTVKDLTNQGTMALKDLTLTGALKGEGIATVRGNLIAEETFRSENKIISDGMEISSNVQKMELSDLEIKDGTTLDIGTREVTAKDVTVGKEATLQVTLNGLDEFGTMAADKIEAGEGAGVHLVLGEKFEGGVFDVFKGTEGAGDLEVKHNNLYHVIEVEEGKYSFMSKKTEELQESLGATKEEVTIAEAMTQGTSSHETFAKMQSEMLVALQSLDNQTVEKAKKALKAVGKSEQSSAQAVASNHVGAVGKVVGGEMKGGSMKGRSGGEEEARSKVYVKGLYDKTKSTMGDGFKARSTGAVLGIQSEVTDALTLGVGYATSQTTAKEDLRRTEVDTNTGFISAHYQPNAWWMSGLATYSRGQYDEQKQVLSSVGTANYDVDSWGIQVMTGYDIKLADAVITPEVGLRYLAVKQEGYTDTLGTTVEATSSDYLTAIVGVKGAWDLGKIRPTVGVNVGYDVISDDVATLNTLANGASYTVNSEALDRLSVGISTGVEAKLGDRTTLKLEYSGTFRKEYKDHSGMLKLEFKF